MSRPPKCRLCQRPVAFFRTAAGNRWRKFDANPVDGRTHQGPPASPVDGERVWSFNELVEDLMVRREVGRQDAEKEAYDVPWYVRHHCPAMPAVVDPTTGQEAR